ncbi:MAG: putative quinol monooxygenase [Pseudomonadota bacterium]
MYGLISQMLVVAEQRDTLIDILLEGTKNMPGCQSYVIAKDSTNEEAVWVTEVWDDKESHAASLNLPAVQRAIAIGKPMITGFGQRIETVPVI